MNAEAGARKDREWAGKMGEHGDKRRTKEGEKLLEWCWREEMMVAGTLFKQKKKGT